MSPLQQQFLALLRLSIGTARDVPAIPARDLQRLYHMAQQQALVGVVFQGVRRLDPHPADGEANRTLLEDLTLEWMADAMAIRRNHERLNTHVAEVFAHLARHGFDGCLLKGQGNAMAYYPDPAARTTGDLDIWLRPHDSPRPRSTAADARRVIALARRSYPQAKAVYHHVECPPYKGTEVELHYRPQFLFSPLHNARLQAYFVREADRQFAHRVTLFSGAPVAIPTTEFNLVFQLCHIFNHLFHEGIGLRQLVDYYYLCLAQDGRPPQSLPPSAPPSPSSPSAPSSHEPSSPDGQPHPATPSSPSGSQLPAPSSHAAWAALLSPLGLHGIGGALMWILTTQLGMDARLTIVEPDARLGRFVLDEILHGGNFGRYDDRYTFTRGPLGRNLQRLWRDLRLVRHFPAEALSEPFFRLWHAVWRMGV